MGVQKTFTIVPPAGPAARTAVDNRPMTSKQVRKAYQAANRVPRLSKAERIKQERAEQERIRKEFEKEKAAARAKLLREKKKAKEQAEMEDKKKKGLPLVTVRPSQDTIAKFFRGNGLGHKRSCEGGGVGETTDAAKAPALPAVEELAEEEDDDDFPSPKRLCNEREPDGGKEAVPEEAPAEPCVVAEPCVITEKPKEPIIEDDFLDGFEILSDEEMSRLSFNEMAVVDKDTVPQSPLKSDAVPVEKSHLHDKTIQDQCTPSKNPEPRFSQDFDLEFGDEEDFELELLALDAVVTCQKPTEEFTDDPLPQSPRKPPRKTTAHELDLGLAFDPGKEAHCAKSQKEYDEAHLMPPPPIPLAPRPSVSSISPVAAEPQAPPLSTQQILFNMDDFFPSSSQQAAELDEEITFISPIKSGLASKVQSPNPPRVSPKGLSPSGPLSSASPKTPKPFFTASGSNERMAVALLRSRRTAEQEEEQRRQTMQRELAELQQARKSETERRAREIRAEGKPQLKHANHAAPRAGRCETASPLITRTPQFSGRKRLVMNDCRAPVKPTLQRRPLIETNPKTVTPDPAPPTVANMSRKVTSLGSNSRPFHNVNRMPVQETPNPANTPANKPKSVNSPPETSESKCPPASQESEFGGSWMDELATELSV
ncbi:hypothetical protein ACQKWADRAFT_300849 [Trichoderma austrokoningii]